MSGDLTLALRTAQSGLLANQVALTTVSNNVSNVNTPGYSRKIVNFETRVLANSGAGVQVSGLSRRVDEGLMKSVRTESATLAALDVQQSYLGRVQDLFGTPESNTSLAHALAEFTAAIDSLALAPEGSLEQNEVARWGKEVALQLNRATETLQDLRREVDVQIAQDVAEINSLLEEIADLNAEIVRAGTVFQDTTNLLDQRDAALDRLAQLIDIEVYDRGNGEVVVFTGSGRVLVDSTARPLSFEPAANVGPGMTHAGGEISGIYVGDPVAANDITNELRSGELYGLVQLRDTILVDLQASLDELAAELRDGVNAIHNGGVGFPGLSDMTSSRIVTEPAVQTFTLAAGEDVAIVLFNPDGSENASTTLDALMTAAGRDIHDPAALPPLTVDDFVVALEGWLVANAGASSTIDYTEQGKIALSLGTPGLGLAFHDLGGAGGDGPVTVNLDVDGDTAADEVGTGFSNFFGFNDFFVDDTVDNLYETDVLSPAFAASAATLTFRDETGLMGTVALAGGESLEEVAAAINAAAIGVTAAVVPDGAGVRLRIGSDNGASITVSDTAANTFLADTGLHRADTTVAASLDVRTDLMVDPSRISRGTVRWDPSLGVAGEYVVTLGDDTAIQDLAGFMTGGTDFDTAGRLPDMTGTFADYAAGLITDVSATAAANESRAEFQRALVDGLKAQSDGIRGVNLDEEMSDVILFEQAYAAAARLLSVIQSMFEALDQALA